MAVNDLIKNLRAAEFATADWMYERAIKNSMGPYSLENLRKLGHPYSKEHPLPMPQPPGIINFQSFQFVEGWRISYFAAWEGAGATATVFNDSTHAKFLEAGGTPQSRMIARPFMKLLEEEAAPIRQAFLEEALAKTFTEVFEND